MSDHKLTAEPRTQFGKGAARKIRRDNKIPAVMYGHGSEPLHITLPGHEFRFGPEATWFSFCHVVATSSLDRRFTGWLARPRDATGW